MSIAERMIKDLRQLSAEVYAHVRLDWEITLGGSGTNCCEAASVIDEINSMFPATKPTEEEINLHIKELEKEIDW